MEPDHFFLGDLVLPVVLSVHPLWSTVCGLKVGSLTHHRCEHPVVQGRHSVLILEPVLGSVGSVQWTTWSDAVLLYTDPDHVDFEQIHPLFPKVVLKVGRVVGSVRDL